MVQLSDGQWLTIGTGTDTPHPHSRFFSISILLALPSMLVKFHGDIPEDLAKIIVVKTQLETNTTIQVCRDSISVPRTPESQHATLSPKPSTRNPQIKP